MDIKFDWWEVLPTLRECIHAELDPERSFEIFVLRVKEVFPNIDWPSVGEIEIQEDVQRLLPAIEAIFVEDPPEITLQGIYFSICNIRNPIHVREFPCLGVQVIGSSMYTDDDPFADWAAEAEYHPMNGILHLSSLQKMYELIHACRSLIKEQVEYAMSMALVACILRCVLGARVVYDSETSNLLGVALGFDSGEVLYLGDFKFVCLPILAPSEKLILPIL
jgi:hypothetical protein